jgi:hypothetical protein
MNWLALNIQLVGLILTFTAADLSTTGSGKLKKDGTLEDLSLLLNSVPLSFKDWNESRAASHRPQQGYFDLLHKLTPWIIAEPRGTLKVSSTAPLNLDFDLNCEKMEYGHVLDGSKRKKPRLLVDLIPFGYDLDKLEVRLLETYDIVDVFIIYESGAILMGETKPLFFELVRRTPRFSRFADKILYLSLTSDELKSHIPPRGSKRNRYWGLSETMRSKPLSLILGKTLANHVATMGRRDKSAENKNATAWAKEAAHALDLRNRLLNKRSRPSALIIQNDADEIPLRDPLFHLKHCNFKRKLSMPIFLPAYMFRVNFHWPVVDISKQGYLGCNGGFISPPGLPKGAYSRRLMEAIWLTGPRLWPLKNVFKHKHTMRLQNKTTCSSHMGLGAAVHLSSIAEPIEMLLKEGSVIEGSARDLSQAFREAGAAQKISPALIMEELVRPRCGSYRSMKEFTRKELAALFNAMPWAVKGNPERYPFLVPRLAKKEFTGIFRSTGDPKWMEKNQQRCNRQVWS